MVSIRQHMFFKGLAARGHQVFVIGPGEWGKLVAKPEVLNGLDLGANSREDAYYQYIPLRHIGSDIYGFTFLGLAETLEKLSSPVPLDWLYIQQEPGASLTYECIRWIKYLSPTTKIAIFTWENISLKGGMQGIRDVNAADLVICGNPDAEIIMQQVIQDQKKTNTHLMLQVGINTDLFEARPLERDVTVGYIGRKEPEKGLPYLAEAWPTVHLYDWTPYEKMPWPLSCLKVLVSFSQDVPFWKEQAPNYTVIEALSCGCNAVISNTAAMKFWLKECPGVTIVEGCKQTGAKLDPVRTANLRAGIIHALDNFEANIARQFIVDRWSIPAMAKELEGVLLGS
jgi:hypothetical protein